MQIHAMAKQVAFFEIAAVESFVKEAQDLGIIVIMELASACERQEFLLNSQKARRGKHQRNHGGRRYYHDRRPCRAPAHSSQRKATI